MIKINLLKKYLIALNAIALIISCKANCEIEELHTISTLKGDGPTGISYMHNVLLKNVSKNCVDSIMMVNLAKNYIDTVKKDKPIDLVCFYNSTSDFDLDEVSQNMEQIDKSCLVKIGFNIKTKQPTDFSFFNQNGQRIYSGTKWLISK
ncbi:hypothetical protein DYU05_12915 [Mucilaginibacter terrenus]|uniref:Lipoprotein n=1 Tax=Mucilaginibacter terrenus TaxID=2482727 RepID=A0A3E2NPW0_9SPHI|nr:hypothetical protein [Mucilaginibacter terrenus]RFZ83045.1 hypothetical protein DYU05_12915 [Mucilaginibacter terrenus]